MNLTLNAHAKNLAKYKTLVDQPTEPCSGESRITTVTHGDGTLDHPIPSWHADQAPPPANVVRLDPAAKGRQGLWRWEP